jgi:hypothetical protein
MANKPGQHIPKPQRDDMARIAVCLSANLSNAEARKAVAGLFQVSVTTAKRLILRGRHLSLQGEIEKATA